VSGPDLIMEVVNPLIESIMQPIDTGLGIKIDFGLADNVQVNADTSLLIPINIYPDFNGFI
jgi:hypothetical protein